MKPAGLAIHVEDRGGVAPAGLIATPHRGGGVSYGQFPAEVRDAQRREIRDQGTLADPWVARAKDLPSFGLNLACSWPFPAGTREAYGRFAATLTQVPGLSVYAPEQTHITLATLVSFHLHLAPDEAALAALEAVAARALARLKQGWHELAWMAPFELHAEVPILTRKACFIPWGNPGGEIAAIRDGLRRWIESDPVLMSDLSSRGFNVPGIIHSTVARFAEGSDAGSDVLGCFDRAAAVFELPPMRVDEILVTAELCPYMARGETRHRFCLAVGDHSSIVVTENHGIE